MYDIVCIGAYTKDTVVTQSGTRVVPGGAFNYGAHAARALGLRTAAITRLAREDEAVVRELEALGVEVRATWTPTSTCIRLEYPTQNPDDRILTVTAEAGPFSPEEVAGIESRAAVLGPSFYGEIGVDIVRALAVPDRIVALDAQGFIRRTSEGRVFLAAWDERREVLPLVTVLKVDAVESRFLTGESDLLTAAQQLRAEGPREVLLTHRDGVLAFDGTSVSEAPFLPARLVGRSGRGDTCLAAYVSRRLVDPPEEALRWAAALTSKKLEADGPYRGDAAAVERFVDERYRHTG
jgi:sugar/nucleoside kinase (ribokinase family)